MKSLSILLLIVLIAVNSQIPSFDESFRAFCSRAGATLIRTPPISKKAPPHGDKCTVNWGIWAENLDDARQICMDMGVFHLSSWTQDSSNYALCEYEAILLCRAGFIQIRGKCYKVVRNGELRKISDAREDCKAEGLKVFRYIDVEIARIIAEFFENLEGIWAELPDGADLEVFYDDNGKGSHYMVAYGNCYWFELGYGSLVKVEDKAIANVLCEYTPPDTILAFKSKLEKIKPYIFPAHSNGVTTYWRTWNYYDDRLYGYGSMTFRDHCQHSMKPLLNSNMGNALDPRRSEIEEMPEELKKSLPLAFAPFRNTGDFQCLISLATDIDFTQISCARSEVTPRDYNVDCNGRCPLSYTRNMYQLIFHPNGKDYKIVRSPIPRGPNWCDIAYIPPKMYKACSNGWQTYDRRDGSRYCHIYVDKKKSFNSASSYCNSEYNAIVSAFAEELEYNVLNGLGVGWTNAYKSEICKVEVSGKCSKFEMFTFRTSAGDMSYDGRRLIGRLMAPGQPDRITEHCVDVQLDGLHDSDCSELKPFFCGKEADEA